MTTDALGSLQALLGELFKFESKELDFGIYRIAGQRRGEFERFIQCGLVREEWRNLCLGPGTLRDAVRL